MRFNKPAEDGHRGDIIMEMNKRRAGVRGSLYYEPEHGGGWIEPCK